MIAISEQAAAADPALPRWLTAAVRRDDVRQLGISERSLRHRLAERRATTAA